MESSPVILESSSQELRWKPGPEQIRILKEAYSRLGGKLPSKEEVESLIPELKPYGDVEARRVYFWFRNHRRRKITEAVKARASDSATSSLAITPVSQSPSNTSTALVGASSDITPFFTPKVTIDVTTTIVCASRPPMNLSNIHATYPRGLTHHFQQASSMLDHLYWNSRANLGMLDGRGLASTAGLNYLHGGNGYIFYPVLSGNQQELELFGVQPEGLAENVTAEDAAVDSELRLGGNHLDLGRFRSSSDNLDGMDLTLKLGPPSN